VLLTHANADVDAVASVLGFAELLSRTRGGAIKALFPEGVGREARRLLMPLEKLAEIRVVRSNSDIGMPPRAADVCIVLDTASRNQLRKAQAVLQGCSRIVLIDHHSEGDLAQIADIAIVDPFASSTSEIVLLIAHKLGVTLSPDTLTALIAGVVSDTKRFSHGVSPETFLLIAWALSSGGSYRNALELLRHEAPPSARIARLKCLSRLVIMRGDQLYVCISHVGAYESECASTLIGIGCDAAFVASDDKSTKSVRVVFRAKSGFVEGVGDVYSSILSTLVKRFGGGLGGHKQAGGVLLKTRDRLSVVCELIRVVRSVLEDRVGRVEELREEPKCSDGP